MANALQRAIAAWSTVNFNNFQKVLDEQGAKVAANQDEGTTHRKELATKTREFRKLPDEDKLGQVKGLLKLYQTEIDNLTNRSKYAESCLLDCYKVLGDVADPLPLLKAAESSITKANEADALKSSNAKLQEDLSRVSDYAKIKAKLVEAEKKQERTIAEAVSLKEKELNALWDERKKSWETREKELFDDLSETKQNYQVAQARLAGESSASPSDANLRMAEHSATVKELERATRKVAQVESRNAQLRQQLEAAKGGDEVLQLKQEHGTQLLALENENMRLMERYEEGSRELKKLADANDSAISALQAQQQQTLEELKQARATNAQRQDYDTIKSELEFLRSVEFGEDSSTKLDGQESDLEEILRSRNAKLTEDLSSIRLKMKELESDNSGLRNSAKALTENLAKSQALVEQLENDLSTVHKNDNNETFSMISGWTAAPKRQLSPASSIAAGSQSRRLKDQPAPVAGSRGDTSVLAIITQQRDRLKEKTLELEENLRRSGTVVADMRKELDAVKNDNVELYERIRYIQAHGKDKDGKVDRYKSLYEDGLTSFQQFKSLELERALAGKGRLDRATFALVQKAAASAHFRNGIIIYFVFVHVVLVGLLV